jgi:type IX secretion system PorP/SprF family membrane protein
MKKILILVLTLVVFGKLAAQDDMQATQLYSNKLYYNPAATGFSDKFFVSGAYRTQWTGTPGLLGELPRYVLLNATQYFWEQRSGIGLSIYDARQSVNKSFQAKVAYAYHLQVQEEAWLAMGTSVGLLTRRINGAKTPEGNPVDERTSMMSDMALGVEYYTPELCVGASVQHIPLVVGESEKRMHSHFYYYMMYYYQIDDDWRLIPSISLRNSSFITNFDIVARISYQNMVQLGASYRMDAIAFLLGFNLSDTFSLGYSIDISTGFMRQNGTRPSHELVLSYRTQVIKSFNSLQRLQNQSDF